MVITIGNGVVLFRDKLREMSGVILADGSTHLISDLFWGKIASAYSSSKTHLTDESADSGVGRFVAKDPVVGSSNRIIFTARHEDNTITIDTILNFGSIKISNTVTINYQ